MQQSEIDQVNSLPRNETQELPQQSNKFGPVLWFVCGAACGFLLMLVTQRLFRRPSRNNNEQRREADLTIK